MKRLFALLVLCLLPACALAGSSSAQALSAPAPLDLSLYALPAPAEDENVYEPVVLSPQIAYQLVYHHSDYYLRRYEHGQQTQNFRLPPVPGPLRFDICPASHGVRLCMGIKLSSSGPGERRDYTLYDVGEYSLLHPRALEGHPYDLHSYIGGFAGMCAYDEESSLLALYSEDLSSVRRFTVPLPDAQIYTCVRSGDALYVQVSGFADSGMLLLRIGDDDTVWAQPVSFDEAHLLSLHPDGQGGVLLTGSLREDYMQEHIVRYDASGALIWQKTLSAPKIVVSIASSLENEDGTVTLYGSATAKSRGIFTLYALRLNSFGNILSVSAYDFSAAQDIHDTVLCAADGTPMAYAPGLSSGRAYLLPLMELPAADNPGLWLE